MRRFLPAVPLLLLVLSPAGAEDKPLVDVNLIARVEPSITLPLLTYEPKEAIAVTLELNNPAGVPVDVPAACLSARAMGVAAVGATQPLKGSGRLGDGKGFTLAPRAGRKIDFELTRLFKIREVGRYRVSWDCGSWQTPHYDFFVTAPYDREKDRIAVVTTDLGTLEMVLLPEQAPEHVRNFVRLARAGYYDGVLFSRIIPGLEADAGDFGGEGEGAWRHQLAPEIDQTIRPGKGLVGAVRRQSSLTSATMFFILLEAQPGYQGLHTFFAYVRSGMEVLDALSGLEPAAGNGPGAFRPKQAIAIRKIEIKAP